MLGAIIGDTVGSVYEFNNTKDYNFTLFMGESGYTDDSIMTMAVACAPLIPSGWLWVMAAEMPATLSVSSKVSKNHPTALTRIAEPFPKLPYGWRPVDDSYGASPYLESN